MVVRRVDHWADRMDAQSAVPRTGWKAEEKAVQMADQMAGRMAGPWDVL
jgi:hypothetical protein